MATKMEFKIFHNDGIAVERYITTEGKHVVRMLENETGEVIGCTFYSSPQLAKAAYETMIAKVAYYDGPLA